MCNMHSNTHVKTLDSVVHASLVHREREMAFDSLVTFSLNSSIVLNLLPRSSNFIFGSKIISGQRAMARFHHSHIRSVETYDVKKDKSLYCSIEGAHSSLTITTSRKQSAWLLGPFLSFGSSSKHHSKDCYFILMANSDTLVSFNIVICFMKVGSVWESEAIF